jgi:serine O-acetyltransferase
MAGLDPASPPTFREMMFSDYARMRPRTRPSWLGVVMLLPISSHLLASLFLRCQQCLVRAGYIRLAWITRTVAGSVTGADFVPGAEVGLRVMLTHPSGIVLGPGSKIGNNVTFAGGVVLGVKNDDDKDPITGKGDYPTIGDGVFLGAHCVILGDVRVGDNAIVGANSVVRSDVAERSIVSGIPAMHVAYRELPGDAAAAPA